jgi:O-antigen ligase
VIKPLPDTSARSATHKWVYRIAYALAMALLAAGAIALGVALGTRIAQDKWVPLVTISGLATYLVIAVIEPRHALMIWIATAPFARFTYLDIDLGSGIPNLTLNRVMTAVLVVLVLAQVASRRRQALRLAWVDVFLLVFLVAGIASVPNSQMGLKSGIQYFFDLLVVPIAVYFLARMLIRDKRDLRAVMITMVIVGLYLALLATREQITGDVWFYPEDRSVQYTRSIRRVVALLGNPAYISLAIAMAMPWAWYLFLNTRSHRGKLFLIIVALAVGSYMCMNRSGWAALVAGLVVMAIFVKGFRRYFVVIAVAAAIVLSTYWVLVMSSTTVRERLQAQGPIEYRAEAWEVAFRMIKDYPTFGVGFENYQRFYRRYAPFDIYFRVDPTPHNTFLWVMLMGGLFAFVPFMLFLIAIASFSLGMLRGGRVTADGATESELAGVFLAFLAAVLVPSLATDIFYGYYNNLLLFFVLGSFIGAIYGERQRIAERVPQGQPLSAVAQDRGPSSQHSA